VKKPSRNWEARKSQIKKVLGRVGKTKEIGRGEEAIR
jgi:hypothetical protein